jgi:hypothetical protein
MFNWKLEDTIMKLSDFSLNELQQEIKRREELRPPMERQFYGQELDYDSVQGIMGTCKAYMEAVVKSNGEEINDDLEHDVFEKAMEFAYGKTVWDYINTRQS